MLQDTPSDNQYVTEQYSVYVSIDELPLNNERELRRYARDTLKQKIGDDVDVDHVKVRRPSLMKKSVSKLLKKPPLVRLIVVTRF